MANFFISPGNIDKKLLLPVISLLINIFLDFYWEYYYSKEIILACYYLEYFGSSIGQIMTFFLNSYLYNGLYMNNKNQKKRKK